MKPGWSKPATILFATEVPTNEKAFAFALAQAAEFGAKLILFHVYDTMIAPESEAPGIRHYDEEAAAKVEKHHLDALAKRVREAGVDCEAIARRGLPADEIVAFTDEREIDRIVMGTHSPGAISKLLVGSVAEAVLRKAVVPVLVVGPGVAHERYQRLATRTILCAVGMREDSATVAAFAAELAEQHGARLILQHVIRPQERAEVMAAQSLDRLEASMMALTPAKLHGKVTMETVVVPGDPTEELLYQSRRQQADLIVLGAHGASTFAAVTRHGVVYKVLAHAECPVITLSPVVLADSAAKPEHLQPTEAYMGGVF
jgi:nucleotide-binding universal stress UspA family protein